MAAYKFVALDRLPALQDALSQALAARGILGTVLLADEGINLFLAADSAALHDFLAWLRLDRRFKALNARQSWSAAAPFAKLQVKIKPEIIRPNRPAVRPQAGRAPAVDAATFRRWLDNGQDDGGRPVVALDTRNTYETAAGTFRQAIDWRLEKFTDFPQALLDHSHELADKTVVTFCTGGIRCEKAALFMQGAGIAPVFQLDGGILNYFDICGTAHFDGECFVFDARRGVAAAHRPRVDIGASSDSAARQTVECLPA